MDRLRQVSQGPIDDEERELMDADSWDWAHAIEGETVGDPGAVLTLRLTKDEYLALGQLADEAGVGTAEFIRRTMMHLVTERKQQHPSHFRRPA